MSASTYTANGHKFSPESYTCVKCGLAFRIYHLHPNLFTECKPMLSNKEIEEDRLAAQKKIQEGQQEFIEILRKQAEEKLSELDKAEPQIVYVPGRTLWDFISELEWPKKKTLLKTLACALIFLVAIGSIFFAAWFHHFGVEWAREPVVIVTILWNIASILGIFAIIVEGLE